MKHIIWVLLVILLANCQTQPQVTPTSQSMPTSNASIVELPAKHVTPEPTPVELPAKRVTSEPTPTVASCYELPNGMSIHIRRKGDVHGTIEVEGLQPGERPILLLTGEATMAKWRKETQYENAVGADGRSHYNFDFRGWESLEDYQFQGQLIHERGAACFFIELPLPDDTLNTVAQANGTSFIYSLSDYPPRSQPYRMESGKFWLVHTPEGQLFVFAPESPEYADRIMMDECRFSWIESVQRFGDPCSGDEWELDGMLDLENSGELWSNQNLNQYRVMVEDGTLFVQINQLAQGLPIQDAPLVQDVQYGVRLTAVSSQFTSSATAINTLVQVDPIWQMDATAFPPQQALTYSTFPDSLFDDQGRAVPSTSRRAELPVADLETGGLQQVMYNRWEAVAPDANTVTATLTVDLSSLHRDVILPLDWDSHQAGDTWEVDFPLEIGHAAARVRQVVWVEELENGRSRLTLTVSNDSPPDINLYCLHLDTEDPWQEDCGNFEEELTYTVSVPSGEPVALHLRASLAFLTPFEISLGVIR